MQAEDSLTVSKYVTQVLKLEHAHLSDEYYYHSLPLCVIDAVFSIGVRYTAVQQTVSRYCAHFQLPLFRRDRWSLPDQTEQQSMTSFCQSFREKGVAAMTTVVFANRQRTSPKNGILKSEAVLQFASVLQRHHVDYLQDMKSDKSALFESEIRAIPGQKSGVSLQYFQMLAGSDELVKPDRMILRFLESALGRPVAVADAKPLLTGAVGHLRQFHPHITPRLLDYEIWRHQRED
jgi:hypothetical protein